MARMSVRRYGPLSVLVYPFGVLDAFLHGASVTAHLAGNRLLGHRQLSAIAHSHRCIRY